jgi:vesicle-fusing ATPase
MSSVLQANPEWQERAVPGMESVLAHWLRQVQLRLRRELGWCWYQRTGQGGAESAMLPPLEDALREGPHWSFNLQHRSWFYTSDSIARQLTEELRETAPAPADGAARGSFAWVCDALALSAAERFVLALALAHRLDSGIGPACASCMNDLGRPFPTLSLAQRLWDEPAAIVALANPDHRLFRTGLLQWRHESGMDWLQPVEPGPLVTAVLADTERRTPSGLHRLVVDDLRDIPDRELWAARLQSAVAALQWVPLSGAAEADFGPWAARLGGLAGRAVMAMDASAVRQPGIAACATWAWLHGLDLMLPEGVEIDPASEVPAGPPIRCYVPCLSGTAPALPRERATPPFEVPATTFEHRLRLFGQGLGRSAGTLRPAIEECARRFRLGQQQIDRIGRELALQTDVSAAMLSAACRAESGSEMQRLTQRVVPRFSVQQLVLPDGQQRQFDELRRAARSLTEVHYRWGTAQAWNEGGLAVLFHGPPGTGKTMAAEALANDLGLEMYRIDLSQVISKYIGETEKNLRRIFDAADASDCVLFFDEADAIFGKRTEVKDAHDRYANIEVSYLLERMERFKGIAILASNRRKDLDEAFLRRLRYSLAFPIPDVAQREAIWRSAFPAPVDTTDLDFRFLARQFAFSGGHIKSVVFNTCLQAAADPQGEPAGDLVGRPSMRQVLLQVKRELQKLDRLSGIEQFGPHAALVTEGEA